MAASTDAGKQADWIGDWIDAVEAGRLTMSQRSIASIEAHGGLAVAIEKARAKGVHLVELTDDAGKRLVAASKETFTTLC
jgi:hypothetical protein